jgi:hypothetical protein
MHFDTVASFKDKVNNGPMAINVPKYITNQFNNLDMDQHMLKKFTSFRTIESPSPAQN